MRLADVKKFVFSSTTATYGEPDQVPISEDTPQRPINPYGFTKLVIEQALADYAEAYGMGYAAARYFNAAGAHPDGTIGEDHEPETHLIPIVLRLHWANEIQLPSLVTTIKRAMGLAFETMCMSMTWPMLISKLSTRLGHQLGSA